MFAGFEVMASKRLEPRGRSLNDTHVHRATFQKYNRRE